MMASCVSASVIFYLGAHGLNNDYSKKMLQTNEHHTLFYTNLYEKLGVDHYINSMEHAAMQENIVNLKPALENKTPEEPVKKRISISIPWKKLIPVSFIAFILIGSLGIFYYVYKYEPQLFSVFSDDFKKAGFIEDSPAEIARRNKINQLPIEYEKKQILINKSVFLGATPKMVMLALGQPRSGHKSGSEVILVYHLPNESRPTALKFQDSKLVDAYKSSSIEFTNMPEPYQIPQ